MSDTIIRVENVSKRYWLGKNGNSDGLRHIIHDATTWPMRWLKARTVRAKQGGAQTPDAETSGKKPPQEFWALKDVSFEIKQGDAVAIIGRNGAGKSTLLKNLSRITEPTQGRVEISGRVASLLEVGTGFHPELSGRENIFLNGSILGMRRSEIKEKFDEIVAFAEVEKFLDTPVKRYSSGMYVRLAFAVAAHLEPEILIVDEVLAVGDAQFQKKCLGKMQDVSKGGRTVLFVSHNMDTVLRLCKLGIFMESGRLSFNGSATETVAKYSQKAVETKREICVPPQARAANMRRQVLIHRFCWPDNDTRPWLLGFGKDIIFDVEFEVASPVEFADLGIGLFSNTGVEIASCLSSQMTKLEPLSPGRHRCRVHYRDVRLLPGHYSLNVGFRSNFGMEDYVSEGIRLEIFSNETSSALRTDTLRGFFVPNTNMQFATCNND